jgi:hypothetical protein
MAKFYNLADQKLFEQYKFLPQEQYRLGLNLPTTPDPDPVVDQGIVNTNSFANSGGGNDNFNPDGNAFGYGSQIEPGGSYGSYDSINYTGGLPGDVQQYGVGRQFEDPSASPIGETYSYKKEVPGFMKVAAGFIPGGTFLLNAAEKKMNANRDEPSGTYGIAGLSDEQKGYYDNLAGSGMLFNGPNGIKTSTGKNFAAKGYVDGQMDIAKGYGFDNMTDEEIEDAIAAEAARHGKKHKGNKGFKYKKMLEASEIYKTNKAIKEKNAKTTTGGTTGTYYTPDGTSGGGAGQGIDISGAGTISNSGNKFQGDSGPSNKQQSDSGYGSDAGFSSAPSKSASSKSSSYSSSRGSNFGGRFHNADGGRAGYFFGGRAGYAEGGPIYSRLGTLSSGVQSAEQQLQGINASLHKAESDLGSDSPGGGSSLAGGPSFTSNFEETNNQGPGSNLLFGGSSGNNSQATPPGQGSDEEPAVPLGSLYGGDKPIRSPMPVPGNPELAGPVSSIGDEFRAGVKTGGAGQTLTGQPLVKQVQMSLINRAYKSPEYLAWADTVVQTGGYPTEENPGEMGGMMNRKPQPMTSAGGGLGSFAPGVDPMGSRKENPTGPLFKSLGLDPQITNLNQLPTGQPQPISEERMNSLNRSAIGNGFYDLNKGLGGLL